MGKNKDISSTEKAIITRRLGDGVSTLEISKLLLRDHRTIKKYVSDCNQQRNRNDKGKFRKINARQKRILKREM